ncbi:Uncharacterised protein [Vibrio cholerae]|nr:Uncharacterised protein [Vibrio cholerae]
MDEAFESRIDLPNHLKRFLSCLPQIERHCFIAAAPEHCLMTKLQKGMGVSDLITM